MYSFILATVLSFYVYVASAAIISSIEPRSGSIAGGSYVTINGLGFKNGGVDTQVVAFFGNNPCRHEPYDSTDYKFVCYSPPGDFTGAVTVRVAMISVDATATYATCTGTCTYTYSLGNTPKVYRFTQGGFFNSLARAYGQLYGDSVSQYYIDVNKVVADVDESLQLQVNTDDMVDNSGHGTVRFTFGDNEAGEYNVTLEVRSRTTGYGVPTFNRNSYLVDGNGNTYHYVHRPVITGLSQHESGLAGGDILIISGSGFSYNVSKNFVFVAGVPCDVISSTLTEIQCRIGATSAPVSFNNVTYHRGVAGFHTTEYAGYFNNVNVPIHPSFPVLKNYISVDGLQNPYYNEMDSYSIVHEGHFIPPISANYSFWVNGDDISSFQLSDTESPANLTLLAYANTYTTTFYTYASQRQTVPVYLNKGDRYFFRVRTSEGNGGDHFISAVRIHLEEDETAMADAISAGIRNQYQLRDKQVPSVQTIQTSVAIIREMQQIRIWNARSGTWGVLANGALTTRGVIELAVGAPASDVQYALASVGGCGSISVTRRAISDPVTNATGFEYNMTFNCNTYNPFPTVTAYNLGLAPELGRSISFENVLLRSASEPLSGYMVVRMNESTSVNVMFDSDANTVRNAMMALSGVSDVEVTASNTDVRSGRTWAVTFNNAYSVSHLVVDTEYLTGLNSTAVSSVVIDASSDPLLAPIPPQYFEVAATMPVVSVVTNGIQSTCDISSELLSPRANVSLVSDEFVPSSYGPCEFSYRESLTATLNSVSLSSIRPGDNLTLEGIFVTPEYASSIGVDVHNLTSSVIFGAEGIANACEITYLSENEIHCTVGYLESGTYDVDVHTSNGFGRAVRPSSPSVTFENGVTGFSPVSGSLVGGTVITVEGYGFSLTPSANSASLNVGGSTVACRVVATTLQTLTCVTSTSASSTDVSGTLIVNGVTFSDYTFEFRADKTAELTSISPSVLSAATSNWVHLTAVGIEPNAPLQLQFGSRTCEVNVTYGATSADTTYISCILYRMRPDSTTPDVAVPFLTVDDWGYANARTNALTQSFKVTSISPNYVSREGGTLLTISGQGFLGRLASTEVSFSRLSLEDPTGMYSVRCNVVSIASNGESLQCVTGKPNEFYILDWFEAGLEVSGQITVKVNGIPAVCVNDGCTLTYSHENTPNVTSVSYDVDTSSIVIEGEAFEGTMQVWIGSSKLPAEKISVNAEKTEIVVSDVPVYPAGPYLVFVHSESIGNAFMGNNKTLHTIDFPLEIFGFYEDPLDQNISIGSAAGGHVVSIYGRGFSRNPRRNTVKVNNVNAVVLESSPTRITFQTPPATVTNGQTLDVTVSLAVLSNDHMPAFTAVAPQKYRYSAAANMRTITRVISTDVTPGSNVTIQGTNLATADFSYVVASFGGAPCEIFEAEATNTSVICALTDVPFGIHRISMFFPDFGNARVTGSAALTSIVVVPSSANVTTVNMPLNSENPSFSVFGGEIITLTGSGFGSSTNGATTTVSVCGKDCPVVSSTWNEVRCALPKVPTFGSVTTHKGTLPEILKGTSFGTSASPSSTAFPRALDGSVETSFKSCEVGIDLGAFNWALLTRFRFYPVFRNVAAFRYSEVRVSADGVSYTTVGKVGGYVDEGWNVLEIVDVDDVDVRAGLLSANPTPVRYMKWVSTQGDCRGMEIQFIGVPVHNETAGTSSTCPIEIAVKPAPTAVVPAPVIARFDLGTSPVLRVSHLSTPFISSIYPNNGTSLGGDLVVLSGTNLNIPGSSNPLPTVKLNGVECDVQSASETSITCITGRRSEIMETSVEVNVPGLGIAALDIGVTYYRYLDRWSALNTWLNDEPPVEGDTVYVPPGQSLLVDVSTPVLNAVIVQGEMVFDRKDLTFDAHYLFAHGGRIEAGTETDPFLNKLTITMHGDRYKTVEMPNFGAKMIVCMNRGLPFSRHEHESQHTPDWSYDPFDASAQVSFILGENYGADSSISLTQKTENHMEMSMDADSPGSNGVPVASQLHVGRLDFHGRPRARTWTRVAVTAEEGTDIIRTAQNIDFDAGDLIVITSSSPRFDEAEELTVVERIDDFTIRVSPPLKYTHESYTIPAGQYGHSDLEIRCEVGLISRNIVLQGHPDSAKQLYGMHSGAFHGGVLRIENTEVRNCGQGYILGRYCIHFHLHGTAAQSYVRSNSIHHSFQRAVTVHGTHYARVIGNFAYYVRGHNFFMEDGVERYNVIEGNLAAMTLRSHASLKGDLKPASFWGASPTNFWRHNVAAGSINDGFWLELPGNPHGPSYSPYYCPDQAPLGQFFNNSAHSNGVHGLRIYPHYAPKVTMCDPTSDNDPQFFYNFTTYRNGQNGIFGKMNGDLHHVNTKFYANLLEDFSQKFYEDPVFRDIPNLDNVLFINSLTPEPNAKTYPAILAPQDEYWYIDGATFVNHRYAFEPCNDCNSQVEMAQGGFTYRTRNLSFINVTQKVKWSYPYKDIFWDLDGSFFNLGADSYLSYGWQFNNVTGCTSVPQAGYAIGCAAPLAIRKVQVTGHNPSELDFQNLRVSNSEDRADVVQFRPRKEYGWTIPMVTSQWYNMTFQSLVDWRTLNLRYSEPALVESDLNEWIGTNWTWWDYRYRIRSLYQGKPTQEVDPLPWGSLPTREHHFGTGAMPQGEFNRSWSVIMTPNINDTDKFADNATTYMLAAAAIQCPPQGCYVPPISNVGEPVMWSDPNSWPNGKVPEEGENVLINSTTYIIMDVNPPRLGKVTIEGRLDFKDDAERRLTAHSIIVWGSFNVGTDAQPFYNKASITLYGQRDSPSVVVDNNLFVGNKMMLILGNASFVAPPRATTWTTLTESASIGSTSISLPKSVTNSFLIGDSIVITPTSFDYKQAEVVTITSIYDGGRTINFEPPLRHRHYSGPAAAKGLHKDVFLPSAVGVLNRTLVIQGELRAEEPTYGGHIYVSGIYRPQSMNAGEIREGNLVARYIEFKNMGKGAMEHGALNFQYGAYDLDPSYTPDATVPIANRRSSIIEGSVFNTCFNYGVNALASRHLILKNNVLYKTFRSGIQLDAGSTNATIDGNLLVWNERSPDVNAEDQLQWIAPQAAIFLNTPARSLKGNFVGGAYDSAYTLRAASCGSQPYMSDNVASSSLIGVFILTTRVGCTVVSGFTVVHAAHIGILAVDHVSDLTVTDSVVSDSHIGVSLNFISSKKAEAASTLTRSFIIGNSLSSTEGVSNVCATNAVCRAMTMDDVRADSGVCGSVFGSAFRRVGVMLPQYTNRGKTCENDFLPVCRPVNRPERLCGFPWENRFGLPSTRNTHFYMTNVTFADFEDQCSSKSRAISVNPTQVDHPVPMSASSVRWQNVSTSSKFFFGSTHMTIGECRTGNCDGHMHINLNDVDGSLMGTPASAVLGANPLMSEPSPQCTYYESWPGIYCPGMQFTPMIYEVMDSDRGHRVLGTLQIIRHYDDQDPLKNTTTTSNGPVDDHCAKRFYFAQYPFLVRPNRRMTLRIPASEPKQSRFHYLSTRPNEKLLVDFFVTKPNSFTMHIDGTLVPDKYARTWADAPNITEPIGTNLRHPQERIVRFVLGSTAPELKGAIYYDIVRSSSIQLTLKLHISEANFFEQDLIQNVALLLAIDPIRIKVVSVHADTGGLGRRLASATTDVALEILPPPTANELVLEPEDSTDGANAVTQSMIDLADAIQVMANNGGFVLENFEVLSLAVVPPTLPATGPPPPPPVLEDQETSSGTLSGGTIAGIAIGALCAVFIIAGAVVVVRRNSKIGDLERRVGVLGSIPQPAAVVTSTSFETQNPHAHYRGADATSVHIGGHFKPGSRASVRVASEPMRPKH